MKNLTILPIIYACILIYPKNISAAYFPEPTSSPVQMHLAGALTINSKPAQPGDEISITDKQGKTLGLFQIKKQGIYGDLTISGDYPLSGSKEGAMQGEKLKIRIWQKITNKEYTGTNITIITPQKSMGIYQIYRSQQLHYNRGFFYLMNIKVNGSRDQ